ncbi:MAG TPA: SagB/ThcOx family dehydrogenase [Terriglobia bacterium]|nr:SagB/ThcOx family dehydrogenase [Terriglobia bacterium]
MRQSSRLRRSPYVVCYWDGPQLVVHNYLTCVRLTASPFTVVLLSLLSTPIHAADIPQLLPQFSRRSVLRTIQQLVSLTLVEEISPAQQQRDKAMRLWSNWGIDAQFFHWATKDVRYVKNAQELGRLERRLVAECPQPPLFKRYPRARQIALPDGPMGRAAPLATVLRARRTHRYFSPTPLDLSDLATVLKLTWGVSAYLDLPLMGRIPLKTSPSGGARHPIEVYVATFRVKGLGPGLYHYRADCHRLELVRSGSLESRAEVYCGNQWWTGTAAALFFMTAVFERTMWRYTSSRALRVIYLEAGHLCQTFCLVATALGLAPFCTAALSDSAIERDLGLDGIRESALYVAGVGHPLSNPPRARLITADLIHAI